MFLNLQRYNYKKKIHAHQRPIGANHPSMRGRIVLVGTV